MTRAASLLLASLGFAVTGVVDAASGRGESIYQSSCVACHGADGVGALPGVFDLTTADGPLALADEVLIKRISEGFQSPGSPMAMPPRGGNPSLSDEDLKAVVDYMRKEFAVR